MRRYKIEIKGKKYTIDVQELSADQFRVMTGDQSFDIELTAEQELAEARITPEVLPLRDGDESAIERPTASYHPPSPDTLERPPSVPTPALPLASSDEARTEIHSPMPGTILDVRVKPGDAVTRGQTVCILEAMKMKNAIKSPRDATIAEVCVQAGQSVRYGDMLVRFGEAQP
jgi:glutaconyl-CoA/methylmalonyl-CoA decarboxylase subunit gamma